MTVLDSTNMRCSQEVFSKHALFVCIKKEKSRVLIRYWNMTEHYLSVVVFFIYRWRVSLQIWYLYDCYKQSYGPCYPQNRTIYCFLSFRNWPTPQEKESSHSLENPTDCHMYIHTKENIHRSSLYRDFTRERTSLYPSTKHNGWLSNTIRKCIQ